MWGSHNLAFRVVCLNWLHRLCIILAGCATISDSNVNVSLSQQVTSSTVSVCVCAEQHSSQGLMTDQGIQASDILPEPQMHHRPAVWKMLDGLIHSAADEWSARCVHPEMNVAICLVSGGRPRGYSIHALRVCVCVQYTMINRHTNRSSIQTQMFTF